MADANGDRAVPMMTGHVTATAGLRVRSGPGTNSQIVAVLPHGTEVNILATIGDWYKIDNGYVSAEYVELDAVDSELQAMSDWALLALLIASEADNQPLMGQVAVAMVPMARLHRTPRYGRTLHEVMLKPYQFSTFNDFHYRGFTHRIPHYSMMAQLATAGLLHSPTAGATHYCRYDLDPMPKWTQLQYSTYLGKIGDHVFFMER